MAKAPQQLLAMSATAGSVDQVQHLELRDGSLVARCPDNTSTDEGPGRKSNTRTIQVPTEPGLAASDSLALAGSSAPAILHLGQEL